MTRWSSLLMVLLGAGCLGPQVSDEVGPGGHILPPGSTVPSLYDDPARADAIAEHDGVADLVPLVWGFVDGRPVAYWDFGPAPDVAAPLYRLVQRLADGSFVPLPHPPIFSTIPGDPGYSPFWVPFVVEVTDAYAGETIASTAALEEAERRGLVLAPDGVDININCPVVARDVLLDPGGGAAPRAPESVFYYEGRAGRYFDFGASGLAEDRVHVPVADLLVLSREGGAPLSEPARQVNMTGDGDRVDSNNIFAAAAGADGYTPLTRLVSVTVPAGSSSIDGDLPPRYTSVDELFDGGEPRAGEVIAYQAGGPLYNLPQRKEGGP